MKKVNGQVMREHVVVLALHCERAPVHGHGLPRATDDAEIPDSPGKTLRLSVWISSRARASDPTEGAASRAPGLRFPSPQQEGISCPEA